MAGFRDFNSWSFWYSAGGNLKGIYSIDFAIWPTIIQSFSANNSVGDDADYCNSQESKTVCLSKFVAFWNGRATSLQLTVRTIIFLVTQTSFIRHAPQLET